MWITVVKLMYICISVLKELSWYHKAEKYYSNRISAITKHDEAQSNQATLNSTENAIFLQCKKNITLT
jgi:hypothetical protein